MLHTVITFRATFQPLAVFFSCPVRQPQADGSSWFFSFNDGDHPVCIQDIQAYLSDERVQTQIYLILYEQKVASLSCPGKRE